LKNKKIYYWACDNSENSGEGRLAIFFIKNLKKKFNVIEIKNPKFKINFFKKFFNYKYIKPFVGIIYCWKFFLNEKKVYYVNYLPFWNFIIFLFLPPNSNIGPITGGAKFSENSNFVRKILFPLLYKISEFIVNLRNFNLVFSTDLLKLYLNKKTIKKSSFNFVIKNFENKNKKIKNKKIDFLIYYREHQNKKKFFPFKLIENLISEGFNVNIVGDKLYIPNVVNHGLLKNKTLSKLQQRTRFTIFSEENLYSIFTLECISNNVLILVKKTSNLNINYFKKSFVRINFSNLKELRKLKNLYRN